uniref:Protein MAK16 homolog n=1 Tax=Macrostomum lignano TaxID=282301 RepID=A0A1I8HFG0_9PLAT
MNSDDLIWQIINNSFCSFMTKTKTSKFCRNEYNLTGLCNRHSCPLANSQYATVREEDGVIYLYMKVAERAHLPAKIFDRLLEVQKRSRRLVLTSETKLVPLSRKVERRERRREDKALVRAGLETAIEKEMLDRLRAANPEEFVNVDRAAYEKALQAVEVEDEEDDEESEEEEEDESESETEYVEDFDESEEEIEDIQEQQEEGEEEEPPVRQKLTLSSRGAAAIAPPRKRAKVTVEYDSD